MKMLKTGSSRYWRLLILVFIVAGTFLSFAGNVDALTISPPVLEVKTSKGNRYEDVIKIFNETEKEVVIYTSASNFTAKEGEGGNPRFLTTDEKKDDLAEWITIEKGPIFLRSQERIVVPFEINVPDIANPGGHYAAIFFDSKPPATEGNASVGISGRLGSLILLNVSGEVVEEGRILEFKPKDEMKFYEYMPREFFFRFENLGTVHLKHQGEIFIKNATGKVSSEIEVNKTNSGGNVLPKTIRKYDVASPFLSEDNSLQNL